MLTMLLGLISSIFLTSAQHFFSEPSYSPFGLSGDLSSSEIHIDTSFTTNYNLYTYFTASLDYNLSLTLTESGKTSGSQLLNSFGSQFYICSYVSDSSVPLRSYGATVISSAYIGSFARSINTGGDLTTAGTYNYLVTASNGESYVSTSGSTSDTIYVKKAYLVPVNSASGTSSGSYSGSGSGDVSGSASGSSSGNIAGSTTSFPSPDVLYYPLYINLNVLYNYDPSGLPSYSGFLSLEMRNLYVWADGDYPQTFVSLLPADGYMYFSSSDFKPVYVFTPNNTSFVHFTAPHFNALRSSSYGFWLILKIALSPKTRSIAIRSPSFAAVSYQTTYSVSSTLDALYNELITQRGSSSSQLDSANVTLGNSITQADSQEQKALDAVSGFTTLDYSAPVAAITAYSSELTIFASTVKTLMDNISPLKFLISLGLLLTFLSILFGIFKHQKRGGDG